MVGGRSEKLVEVLVLEDLIENPDLINGGLSTLISDAGGGNEREEEEVDLPNHGLVEHEESKAGIGEEGAGPTVVHSVKARGNLIEVINSAGSPLPEVVSEEIVAELIFVRVSLSLSGLWAGGIDVGPEVNIDVIKALRRSKSQVVVAWSSGLAETSCLCGNKPSGVL